VCRELVWKLGIRRPLGKPMCSWDYSIGKE
jgi:hypothetical protein